jgi:hypothetical protein
MDIGPSELSGVGAFLAVGLSKGDAVGAMLINRALGLGTAAALAIVAMIVLRDQLRAALQTRQSSASSQRAQAPQEASQAVDRV